MSERCCFEILSIAFTFRDSGSVIRTLYGSKKR